MNILILGDGNFSFSLALARFIHEGNNSLSMRKHVLHYLNICEDTMTAKKMTVYATSFDSRQEILKKYPESKEILGYLEQFTFTTVLHGVNAWELSNQFGSASATPVLFDVVAWNHPHLGTEDFRLHRFLMAHFFQSVSQVLNQRENNAQTRPTVCVSVVEGQDDRWDLTDQARKSGIECLSMTPFDESLWPGYVVKRNKNGKSFKNSHTKVHVGHNMMSRLYHFTWSNEATPESKINTIETKENEALIVDFRLKMDLASSDQSSDQSMKKSLTSVFKRKAKPTIENGGVGCPNCGRVLASEAGLKNHIHTVHQLKLYGHQWKPEAESTDACDYCDKTFSNAYDKWQHQVSKHTQVQNGEVTIPSMDASEKSTEEQYEYDYIPCTICGQAVLKKSWGMLLHLETLKPIIGLDMVCPCCNLKFIEQRALFQHYKFCRLKDHSEKSRKRIDKTQPPSVDDIRTLHIKALPIQIV